MDLLAGYGDVGDDNSATNSPKDSKVKIGNTGGVGLENEWLSFEKMIAPGGNQGDSDVDKSKYLVDGVVAYPGMAMLRKQSTSEVELEVQSSESDSDEETEKKHDDDTEKNGKDGEEEDAFLKLRKQVKARDRSSSSDDSSDSSSDSSQSPVSKRGSLSPPHLSPVNSVKSHGSDPPELLHSESVLNEEQPEKEEEKVEAAEKNGDRRKDKERKRSHRDRSGSKSRSRKHRSRSRSRDRKHRRSSRERRRHKDKKSHHKSRDSKRSRDRKKSQDRKRSRSRDRKRSKSKDKHDSKSHSDRRDSHKDRKKDKKSRSRSRDRKGSRSEHKKDRRDRSRDRKKDHGGRSRHRSKDRKSRSRSKHRSRSRERVRSRSRERLRSRSPVLGKKLTFKEQMRQNILTASRMSQDKEPEKLLVKPGEPLKTSDLLRGIKIKPGDSVTPQQALMQTMAAMHQKAQEITGIEVPKYYNPAAVNPLKYAEQVQKRKLLWSKKGDDKEKEKEEQIETQWKSAFIADDNATTSKFRKLMGMKSGEVEPETEENLEKLSVEQRKKQQELFQRLDQEYQFARITTHTQRGVGLGFSSTMYDPNHPPNPP